MQSEGCQLWHRTIPVACKSLQRNVLEKGKRLLLWTGLTMTAQLEQSRKGEHASTSAVYRILHCTRVSSDQTDNIATIRVPRGCAIRKPSQPA